MRPRIVSWSMILNSGCIKFYAQFCFFTQIWCTYNWNDFQVIWWLIWRKVYKELSQVFMQNPFLWDNFHIMTATKNTLKPVWYQHREFDDILSYIINELHIITTKSFSQVPISLIYTIKEIIVIQSHLQQFHFIKRKL